MRRSTPILLLAFALSAAFTRAEEAPAQPTPISKDGLELFEKHIRPVLIEHCYDCHSTQSKRIKGKLVLDSRQGIAKGGEGGPVLVPGDPDASRLITAMRWADEDLEMPPKQKLSAQQIEKFEQWVRLGAPDPRDDAAAAKTVAHATIDIEAGRKWWAFQPVAEVPPPAVKQHAWPRKKIDAFVLAELEKKQLAPSPPADPRTLIQRAYLDLTGLRPTYEQVEAFARDPSPAAYERIIEELLASPHYGERWGRYWLDVARYGEDNPTGEATNPPYPFAWRYRDWVIQAVNRDVPYDRFVKLQLAADLMPDVPRSDLAALTFLGAGPVYHKDGRLSKDVIETLYTDDWDERVDTVTRGILGLTVACARCHDHKFDPITTKDYYSLAGVFASTVAAVRPTADIDPETETRFMAAAQRIFYLSYVANLLRVEPGSKPKEARQKVEGFVVEMDKTLGAMSFLQDQRPELYAHLARLARYPDPYDGQPRRRPALRPAGAQPGAAQGQGQQFNRRGRGRGASTEPFYNAVYDAGLWVNATDGDLTLIDIKPGQPRDMHVLPGGNVSKPGEQAPRGFISVLAKQDPAFHQGSGRLELADRLFTDAAPLSARVMVNRAWAWHFGKPLVATPSDFGLQGDKPTHPALLDDLAARFIANKWSLKWLHREIMLSAAYQQASHPRGDAIKLDPANALVWRMNPRRLDIEAYRDGLLQATGALDRTVAGPSTDLDQPDNRRRTVYARVSRSRLNPLLQLYDFPEATMHSPSRDSTTTPLQQLFAMNSPFMQDQAAALLESVEKEPDAPAKVRAMYRKVLARDPGDAELARATDYLTTGTLPEFAHALLYTNEVIFWP